MQVRKETLPWVEDLVQPFISGPPEPLQDTVPPQQLGDADSRWIEVDGVNLHYKDTGPQSPEAPAVLLLHGFNGSVYSWYGTIAHLKFLPSPFLPLYPHVLVHNAGQRCSA